MKTKDSWYECQYRTCKEYGKKVKLLSRTAAKHFGVREIRCPVCGYIMIDYKKNKK